MESDMGGRLIEEKLCSLVKSPSRRFPFTDNPSMSYKEHAAAAISRTNQGHDDSTLSRSLFRGDGFDAVTRNSVSGHGVLDISSSNSTVSHPVSPGGNGGPDQPHQGTRVLDISSSNSTVSHPVSPGGNGGPDQPHQGTRVLDISSSNSTVSHPVSPGGNGGPGQPHQGTRITSSLWIFSAGFGLEAATAFFDQVSTPQKPQYAFYGMLLSIVAVLVCVLDLISNVIKQGRIASESNILWGVLPEVFGLTLACIQCINSTLQFSFLCGHVAYPLKVSPGPLLFFFILFVFKYRDERNYCRLCGNSQQVSNIEIEVIRG